MSTPPSSQDIFAPIIDPQEKEKILTDLFRYSREIKVKSKDPRADVFLLIPISLTGRKMLCKFASPDQKLGAKDDLVVAQFTLSERKYISQTEVELKESHLILNFSGDLYQVQRRADFRLKLPGSYGAKLRVSAPGSFEGRVLDLSAGGCRFEIPASVSEPSIGDVWKGLLVFSDRDDMQIELTVRRVEPAVGAKGLRVIGGQFVNQTQIVKNRLAALVMDLYREFFASR